MKVISIRQPWASLIINGYKEYEFRSWNTHFRGEVLIHASQSVEKDNLKRFECLNLEYPIGKIIGSAKITDCITVGKKFEDELISKNELAYGATRNRTGYAFKLEEVTKFETPISAKGQLGFWNYYNEFEVMNLLQDIDYGWVDQNNNKHLLVDQNFSSNYQLQSPKEVIKNKLGVCWDQVELERYYFMSNDWNIRTYFLCYYDNDKCPTHTFLTFEKENQFYWFEHSWEKYRGIHNYPSIKKLLEDVRKKFILTELKNNYNEDNLLLREYGKPTYHIKTLEFYNHCEKMNSINIKDVCSSIPKK